MALQPSLNPLIVAGAKDAPHTLDVFREWVPGFPLLSKAANVLFTTDQLFDQQEDFFDIPTSTLTPLQIREKLADIAGSVIQDKDKVEEFKELLKLKSSPNGGVAVTDDLKYTSELELFNSVSDQFQRSALVKFSRQNGVHVSPTVLWDGLVANEVSSSWGEAEWSKFLSEKVKV
ncbi:hypothetical protein J3R82DRAFT_4803 [Butyriboletus roseoflavus]|nr:hypothetical protein J3R82DRAFT_4803 [Butyriboletus roseoflavus]